MYEMIHLEGVRLLSKGKTADAPASKGKAKGKGKGKSKGKGKEQGPSTQKVRSVYFGDSCGYILCTLAFGEDVRRIPNESAEGRW